MEAAPATASLPRPADASLHEPGNFINRELSSLAFNERVLEEAADPSVPLMERLRFLAILSGNLDEFFMIRVAGLKQQIAGHVEETGPDAMSPAEQLQQISQRCHAMVERQETLLLDDLVPRLEAAGVRLLRAGDLSPPQAAKLADYFERDVLPVLTPIALDPSHPFPHLRNKSLNLAVRFGEKAAGRLRYGVVPVPAVLPRLVQLGDAYALLEDVIAAHVSQLFPGMPVDGCWAFRVTRNWDLSIDEDEAEDLLVTIEREVRRRDRGAAVRLQINCAPDEPAAEFLARALHLQPADVYVHRRPLALQEFVPILMARPELKTLHDEPFTPAVPAALAETDLLSVLRERDVLLHHPYESFEPVVSFIEGAADDPAVLAIKMTLYRAGRDNPIVRALQRAAEDGKQVTALVELKARMDEEANIAWARELERAGVHVVYGLIGYKTHCKVALVVRRENDGLRRYVHLGTGNYNATTARSYSDLSLFTARPEMAADATALFNLLTGYSRPTSWHKLLVAPLGLRAALLDLINDEAKAGPAGRIVAKMNALADSDVIVALYRAAQAGVQVDLMVRGICCLRPTERIRVTSVVDRFLEHSRIWFFQARGERKVFLASGDWMQRNFARRVDIAFPVEEPALKERVISEVLAMMQGDNVKAWSLERDGSYKRVQPQGKPPLRSQEQFIALARRATIADASRPPSVQTLLSPSDAPRRRKKK
ncbi:MAG TPA: polyphosphate kinase 1 [Myxococcales bacterium]|nr:polyphosphate kinase 1 [Myxococcales bacterium]